VTLTLLLDLDDTLLGNSMDTFLPPYLHRLATTLAPHVPDTAQAIEALLAATNATAANDLPDRTLLEVFEAYFYPALGLQPEALEPVITQFYQSEFPKLQKTTQFRPEAVELVECALDRGYQVVIATNPLFPRTAIHQRLEWAGLSPQRYPFAWITSLENAHFAKPNPAYFAEIMALLGWPEGPVLIVGDDLARDIRPANQLGIASFWVNPDSPPPTGAAPTASGSLGEVIDWLDATQGKLLTPDYNSLAAIQATLKATPAALSTLLMSENEAVWMRRVPDDEWNITEVACHLRDVEEQVNLPRLQKILQEDNPFIPGVDTDPWAESRQYYCQHGKTALRAFISHRLKTLELLRKVRAEDWQRPARHAIFGPTHLLEICSFMAGHDRIHLSQVRRILDG